MAYNEREMMVDGRAWITSHHSCSERNSSSGKGGNQRQIFAAEVQSMYYILPADTNSNSMP